MTRGIQDAASAPHPDPVVSAGPLREALERIVEAYEKYPRTVPMYLAAVIREAGAALRAAPEPRNGLAFEHRAMVGATEGNEAGGKYVGPALYPGAAPEPPRDEDFDGYAVERLRALLRQLRRHDLDDGPCWCSTEPSPANGNRHVLTCRQVRTALSESGKGETE